MDVTQLWTSLALNVRSLALAPVNYKNFIHKAKQVVKNIPGR